MQWRATESCCCASSNSCRGRQTQACLLGCLTHLCVQSLIAQLAEDAKATLLSVWGALEALCKTIPRELAPTYVRAAKDAVGSARDRQRRKKLPGPVILPGFCLPKALAPILPIYLQGLLQARLPLQRAGCRCMLSGCSWPLPAGCLCTRSCHRADAALACRAHRRSCASCLLRAWESWCSSPTWTASSPLSSRSQARSCPCALRPALALCGLCCSIGPESTVSGHLCKACAA